MAELDSSGGGGKKGKKVRSKKQSTRVDLTAMVDLAFLLITFFMLTTSLSKPIAMDVVKPVKDDNDKDLTMDFPASRTMTVLLAKNGTAVWYMGTAEEAEKPTQEKISQMGSTLIDMKAKVTKATNNDPKQPFIVVVKPTSASKYSDFVNMMDELNIAKVETVAIEDDKFFPKEIDLLKSKNLL